MAMVVATVVALKALRPWPFDDARHESLDRASGSALGAVAAARPNTILGPAVVSTVAIERDCSAWFVNLSQKGLHTEHLPLYIAEKRLLMCRTPKAGSLCVAYFFVFCFFGLFLLRH